MRIIKCRGRSDEGNIPAASVDRIAGNMSNCKCSLRLENCMSGA